MRIIFLGPPGAGKGTQAELLSKKKSLAHISTGAMLRAAVQEGSELGKRVQGIMESGHLVPDELMIEIIGDRVKKNDCKTGYILDGFPRTVAQAAALDQMLKMQGVKLDGVVSFDLTEEDVMKRLAHRRGAEARKDDDAEVQKERLRVYKTQTAPLIEYYEKAGALRRVESSGSIEQVSELLDKALAA